MNNGELFLLAVVVVAFIAGYSIVSFVVKRMKSEKRTTDPTGGQSHQKDSASDGSADDTGSSETQGEESRQSQSRQWEEEQKRRRSERWESQSETQKHARVLGLKGKITPADVKRAYRESLAKYHPDKVNHLGDEFQCIADERTREIIAAYEFFREKYDIR
jgi:hypothetical protein